MSGNGDDRATTAPKDGGRDAKAGSGIEGTDVEDPLAPGNDAGHDTGTGTETGTETGDGSGFGVPTNDKDDLAGADVTGGGVSDPQ